MWQIATLMSMSKIVRHREVIYSRDLREFVDMRAIHMIKNLKGKVSVSLIILAFAIVGFASADTNVVPLGPASGSVQKSDNTSRTMEGLQLILSAVPTEPDSKAAMVQITMKNKANHVLRFDRSMPVLDYDFIIKDGAGQILPLNQYGRDLTTTSVPVVGGSLNAGQEESANVPVNSIFDVTKGGRYTVSASRYTTSADGKSEVRITSNTTSVDVMPEVFEKAKILPNEVNEEAAKDLTLPPSSLWKVGDSWRYAVDIFVAPDATPDEMTTTEPLAFDSKPNERPGGKSIRVLGSYLMTIKVESIQEVDHVQQVKLLFFPDKGAPSEVDAKTFELVVDRNTGRLIDANSSTGRFGSPVGLLGDYRVIIRSIDGYALGFPSDYIPSLPVKSGSKTSSAELSSRDKATVLAVSQTETNAGRVLQEKLSYKGKDWFEVTQLWPTGSKWWSRYVKEDFSSQRGMRAILFGDSELLWSLPGNDIQVGVGSADVLANGGDTIHVRVGLRNNSDRDLPLAPLLLGRNLQVTVTNGGREQIALTELGKTNEANPISLSAVKNLPAHSTLFVEIPVNKIYDMTRRGMYSINLSYQPDNNPLPKLISPALSVRVTEQQ